MTDVCIVCHQPANRHLCNNCPTCGHDPCRCVLDALDAIDDERRIDSLPFPADKET